MSLLSGYVYSSYQREMDEEGGCGEWLVPFAIIIGIAVLIFVMILAIPWAPYTTLIVHFYADFVQKFGAQDFRWENLALFLTLCLPGALLIWGNILLLFRAIASMNAYVFATLVTLESIPLVLIFFEIMQDHDQDIQDYHVYFIVFPVAVVFLCSLMAVETAHADRASQIKNADTSPVALSRVSIRLFGVVFLLFSAALISTPPILQETSYGLILTAPVPWQDQADAAVSGLPGPAQVALVLAVTFGMYLLLAKGASALDPVHAGLIGAGVAGLAAILMVSAYQETLAPFIQGLPGHDTQVAANLITVLIIPYTAALASMTAFSISSYEADFSGAERWYDYALILSVLVILSILIADHYVPYMQAGLVLR